MKKIFRKELIIGICVLVALAILIFGINFLKGVNIFKAANYYYASYTNVEGLSVSAPVTINGFKVGQVRSIEYEYDNPGHVLVEMSLAKDLRLPSGTKAVLSKDILGTATIKIEMASHSDFHEIGDKLIGVDEPGMLDAIGQDLMPSVGNIIPKVDTLLTNINTLVADPALTASIKRLDAITADLENTTKNLAALTSKLAPIATDVKTITGNVVGMTEDLDDVSGRLKEIPLEEVMSNLEATTNNLKSLSEQLNDPNSSLGKLMKDPSLYNNINTTVNSIDSLFQDIKKNPKRYINIKVF